VLSALRSMRMRLGRRREGIAVAACGWRLPGNCRCPSGIRGSDRGFLGLEGLAAWPPRRKRWLKDWQKQKKNGIGTHLHKDENVPSEYCEVQLFDSPGG